MTGWSGTASFLDAEATGLMSPRKPGPIAASWCLRRAAAASYRDAPGRALACALGKTSRPACGTGMDKVNGAAYAAVELRPVVSHAQFSLRIHRNGPNAHAHPVTGWKG